MKWITLRPVLSVFVFATLALGARSVRAQQVCRSSDENYVCIVPSAAEFGALAASLGKSPEALSQAILSQVDGLFQATNIGPFLKGFQNAQNFSTKGVGVDYASEATLAEVGATLSFASNVDKAYKPSGSYTDPPISGGGASFSIMGGIGLGLFGIDPVMIFGNWFKGSATLGQLKGDYQNWGFHVQYRLFGPTRKSSMAKFLARWGGIAITSGVDYSRLTLSTSSQIKSTFSVPSSIPGDPSASLALASDVAGTLIFSLQQTTWSIPLEVTTSLRLLSLLTIYGGLGMDWQLGGGSEMRVGMDNAKVTNKGFGNLGTATIHINAKANPSPARLREIVGLQLGLFDVVRLFVQVNVTASSPMLASVAGGLRLGF